jgi:hypothetical protein
VWPSRRGVPPLGDLLVHYHALLARAGREDDDNAKAKRVLVAIAGLTHHLLFMHPFTDGNGRMSNLMLQLELARHGFVPALMCNMEPWGLPVAATTIREWELRILGGMYAWKWMRKDYEAQTAKNGSDATVARPYFDASFPSFLTSKLIAEGAKAPCCFTRASMCC